MRFLITTVATLALVAGTAQAQGQGGGKGNDKRGGDAGASMQASNPGRGNDRGGGNEQARGNDRAGPTMAGPQQRGAESRGNAPGNSGNSGNSGNRAANDQRGGNDNRADRAPDRGVQRAASDNRGQGNSGNRGNAVNRGNAGPAVVVDRGRDGDRGLIRVRDIGSLASVGPRGLINGCPPGLAKKRNGCQPPGQVRNNWPFRYDRPDWWGLTGYADGRYAYRDGYLLRLLDGRVASYVPLLGGALSVGNPWPSYYDPVGLPDYYSDYYRLGGPGSYRYFDNVLYRVDPETQAITSIAALLTGDDFTVGRPMPAGYDVYNVPWDYRDRYYDRPDAHYRYSDGYVYQIDPETRLIAAAIELLAG